jgi:hypothetical protein
MHIQPSFGSEERERESRGGLHTPGRIGNLKRTCGRRLSIYLFASLSRMVRCMFVLGDIIRQCWREGGSVSYSTI